MSTVAERLTQIDLKVKRAKEHIAQIHAAISEFLRTNPYAVGSKHDPETRKLIYYVSKVSPIPPCIALIAGDAIQCLMSALDHLAYQLVCSDTGDNPPNRFKIYFPIRENANKYETGKNGKMKGAAQETFDAIDALKPYKGGTDALWMLFQLNNIEKHRLLLTVGSHVASIDIAQYSVPEQIELIRSADWPPATAEAVIGQLKNLHAFFRFKDRGFPLQEGYEILVGGIDAKANPDMQFRFDVALAEPEVIESQSLLETLHEFTTLVEGIVVALTPRLKDTTI